MKYPSLKCKTCRRRLVGGLGGWHCPVCDVITKENMNEKIDELMEDIRERLSLELFLESLPERLGVLEKRVKKLESRKK